VSLDYDNYKRHRDKSFSFYTDIRSADTGSESLINGKSNAKICSYQGYAHELITVRKITITNGFYLITLDHRGNDSFDDSDRYHVVGFLK
jgi:hypothetical protein